MTTAPIEPSSSESFDHDLFQSDQQYYSTVTGDHCHQNDSGPVIENGDLKESDNNKYIVVISPGALCKESEDLKSRKVGQLRIGTVVHVVEMKGRRVRIDSPMSGWISWFNDEQELILQKMGVKLVLMENAILEGQKWKKMVSIFTKITGDTNAVAMVKLEDSHWNLRRAIDRFHRVKYGISDHRIADDNGLEVRDILRRFQRTMSNDTVQILSVPKIKDCRSRKNVFEALLRAKTVELADRGIDRVERRLFHGTKCQNLSQIVENGFNRDFNRRARFGKGTYFSSMASESAKYCDSDQVVLRSKNSSTKVVARVMLFCRVIVGEYCVGHSGSSTPTKEDGKTEFDSMVNRMKSPTVFVIPRDYHAIPTHYIVFRYRKDAK